MEFGTVLLPFSYCIQYYDSGNIVLNSYILLIAIVIVYFDYISRIVGLILLNSSNCSYSVYLTNCWVDGRQYIDVVSRYLIYLRGHLDVLGRVVVRVDDSYIGSSIVYPPYVGQAWTQLRRR